MKKSLLLSLLFSLLVCSGVLAQAPINAAGFRDLNWASTISELEAAGINMQLLDFDRDKKLGNYVRKNDSYALYDVGFYPIYYHFWADKFVAVRAHFNAERDSESFQRLYNNLTAQFGVAQPLTGREGQEAMLWQDGATCVRLSYDQVNKQGSLYIYNQQLQNDYASYLKTLPEQSSNYPNQPEGFASLRWGQKIKELKAEGKNFRANKKGSRAGDFVLDNDDKEFMSIPILAKTYGFWQEQLFSAYVFYKSDDEKQTFEQIYQKLVHSYDEPAYIRFDQDPNVNAQYFAWPGDKTHILLYYFPGKKESYVFFVSPELYLQQQQQ